MPRNSMKVPYLRQDYTKSTLRREDLHEDPIVQFKLWFDQALEMGIQDANAFTLSTLGLHGRPSSRIVLVKDIAKDGFAFYTNQESDKGKEIEDSAHVSMLFFWKEMEKQVRIKGIARKIDDETATKYFQSRPKGSQIGAWASHQSQVIEDRSILENRAEVLKKEYSDAQFLPKPPYWGGYIISPDSVEFWQGREDRLHDRFRYVLRGKNKWNITRLSP